MSNNFSSDGVRELVSPDHVEVAVSSNVSNQYGVVLKGGEWGGRGGRGGEGREERRGRGGEEEGKEGRGGEEGGEGGIGMGEGRGREGGEGMGRARKRDGGAERRTHVYKCDYHIHISDITAEQTMWCAS